MKGMSKLSYFPLKNGMKLYYEEHGTSGETIILMHGWTSNHTVYREPVKYLKDKAHCIIYDHRGHGKSKSANTEPVEMETLASDLHELITGLSLSEVTLVGWSMGAGVAMNYIRQYGCEKLKQVVLCDMTPKQLNDENWNLGLYQGKYTAKNMRQDAGKTFIQLYQSFALGALPKLNQVPHGILRLILRRRLRSCDRKVLTNLSASMKAQDNRDVMENITVPLAYFYAVPGSLFSPDLAKWYQEHVNCPFKAVAFPESTHMMIAEHPEQFANELLKLC